MSRRTLLCEKLTGDTRSLIWTDSRGPGYRHDTCDNTLDLHVLENVYTLFPSTVFAAVITVTDKYLSFIGIWIRIMVHGGQGQLAGRPRTTPMQYPWRGAASLDATQLARVPADNTILWKQQQLHYLLQHAYISVILHILYNVNSYTLEKLQQRQLCARIMHFSALGAHARVTVVVLCVCLSVCLSVYDCSRTTGYEAAHERYQQLQCYNGMINNVAILLKRLRSRDMA